MTWNRHPQCLTAADTLLLVVDLQPSLAAAMWEGDRVTANCALLMDAARIIGVPMIVTVQNRDKLGGPVTAVADRLPDGALPLNKMTFSCLGDPAIASAVQATGRHQVLVCGVETHVCVCQTALDLTHAGLEVHVAADAVSSRTERNWHAGLYRMGSAGAVITTTEMGIYEMLERAGTDAFRQVLKLVR